MNVAQRSFIFGISAANSFPNSVYLRISSLKLCSSIRRIPLVRSAISYAVSVPDLKWAFVFFTVS